MFSKNIRVSIVVCASMLLSACSSVEYVSNREAQKMKSASFAQDYTTNAGKKFGVLLFKSVNKEGTLDNGRAFVIRKNKHEYVAETMLVDATGDKKSSYKKSYLSFGADKKNGMVGFKLRFVY